MSDKRDSTPTGQQLTRNNLRAVNKVALRVTEDRHLEHSSGEVLAHLVLVEHETLPLAGSSRVAGEVVIGLKTEFPPGEETPLHPRYR